MEHKYLEFAKEIALKAGEIMIRYFNEDNVLIDDIEKDIDIREIAYNLCCRSRSEGRFLLSLRRL